MQCKSEVSCLLVNTNSCATVNSHWKVTGSAMCAHLWTLRGKWGATAALRSLDLLLWPPCCGVCAGVFRPHTNTNALLSGTCVITPKGLRKLFILRVGPAVKFDWLAYKGKAAIVHSLSFESPSSVLQKSGLFGEDALAEDSRAMLGSDTRLLRSSPPMKAEKIAYRPCDTRRCNKAWRGAQCGC